MAISALLGEVRTTVRNGNLAFVARHPILHRIAEQLAGFDLGDLSAQQAAIYVGVHRFTKRRLPWGFLIGLQTEQFFDASGTPLWGHKSRAAILRWAL
jgi:hypothetical protein